MPLFIEACFTREGTSAIAVYGKHIFQNNFALAIKLEMFCCLSKTYLQKENVVKIWAINSKSFSRYGLADLLMLHFLMDINSQFC